MTTDVTEQIDDLLMMFKPKKIAKVQSKKPNSNFKTTTSNVYYQNIIDIKKTLDEMLSNIAQDLVTLIKKLPKNKAYSKRILLSNKYGSEKYKIIISLKK